jgi:hypothetical protein
MQLYTLYLISSSVAFAHPPKGREYAERRYDGREADAVADHFKNACVVQNSCLRVGLGFWKKEEAERCRPPYE